MINLLETKINSFRDNFLCFSGEVKDILELCLLAQDGNVIHLKPKQKKEIERLTVKMNKIYNLLGEAFSVMNE